MGIMTRPQAFSPLQARSGGPAPSLAGARIDLALTPPLPQVIEGAIGLSDFIRIAPGKVPTDLLSVMILDSCAATRVFLCTQPRFL